MDTESINALREYVKNAKVNQDLRASKYNPDVPILDKLFMPSEEVVWVCRGMKLRHVVIDNGVYTDIGYFSFSKNVDTALFKFSGQEDNKDGALLFVQILQGTPIIDVNSIPELRNDHLEEEIILPRGSRFRVENHVVYSKNPISDNEKSLRDFESEYNLNDTIDFLNSLNVYFVKYLKNE